MRTWLILASAVTTAMLAACSGGGATTCPSGSVSVGGTSGTCTTTGTGAAAASDLIVSVATSKPTGIQNTGTDTATVTVTAVDSNRNVVASVPVTIVPDATAVVTPSGTVTDATGVLTGTVGLGSDRSNRTIAVAVSSGSLSKIVNIAVTGATLTSTAPAKVSPGSNSTIVYHLVDANGVGMGGEQIAISGAFTATCPTDGNGNCTFPFTAPTSAQQLTFNASAAGTSWTDTVTDSTTTVPSAVGTVVAKSLAANPSTVGINANGSTANQVDIRALFLTDHNQPIPNVRVRFDLDGDKSGIGGTLTSGPDVLVYSDANGVARTTYIPGSRSSGNEAVTIRGCWSSDDFNVVTPAGSACPNGQEITANVTIADQGVSVSIATDGLLAVAADDSSIYQQHFTVQVVDSVNNPRSGVKVSGTVDLPQYYLGELQYRGGVWTTPLDSLGNTVPLIACANEDINRNGNQDTFSTTDATQVEDQNNNGHLDPAAADVVIVPESSGSDVTDEFGRAHFFLEYGRNKAFYDDYVLTFTGTVAGSEGRQTYANTLYALETDVTATGTPAFVKSPYGSNLIFDTTTGLVRQVIVPRTTVTDPSTGKSVVLCGVPH